MAEVIRDMYCAICKAGPYTEAELGYILTHGYLCDNCVEDIREANEAAKKQK